MAKVTSCPDAESLQRLATGQLPAPDMETLAGHLETCADCLARVQHLTSADSLARSLAGARTHAEGPDSDVISRLVSKLKESLIQAGDNSTLTEGLDARTAPPAPAGDATGAEVSAEVAWNFLASPQQPDEIGRLGTYRVLEVLGHGGMGVVFRAEDVQLRRPVALKAMLPTLAVNPASKKRFLREAQTAARIKHDHIVTIHQVGEDRGVPFLAMELLQGEPLDARLRRERPMPVAEVLRVGREVAEGLAAAHEAGLIHRDIKPANIWLEARGSSAPARVKLLDFGLARAADDQAGLTQTGVILGTPAYMAPEQGKGDAAVVDHRADLFSLGCVLYLMATGQMPFKGSDTISTLMSVATDEARPPRELREEIPQGLSDLILRLLAKEADRRPQTAGAVVAALATLERGPADHDRTEAIRRPAPRPQPDGRRHRLRPALLVAGGLALVALIVAGLVFYLPTSNGTIRIEINDPDTEVVLTSTGARIKGADGQQETTVSPGVQSLKVKRGDLEFETDKFEVKKGETVAVKVEFLKGKLVAATKEGTELGSRSAVAAVPVPEAVAWKPTPEQKAWLTAMARLSPAARAEAVRRKLRELNPVIQPPEGTVVLEPKDGPPTKCTIKEWQTHTIWPLVALPTITTLDLSDTAVVDFTPLAELSLTELNADIVLYDVKTEEMVKSVGSLKELNGKPVVRVWEERAKIRGEIDEMVADAGKLSLGDRMAWFGEVMKKLNPGCTARFVADRGADPNEMALWTYEGRTHFRANGPLENVFDLSPLRALGTEVVTIEGGKFSNLTATLPMTVRELTVRENRFFTDLSSVRGLQLSRLDLTYCPVRDLSPLTGMPLKSLELFGDMVVTDLSPLAGLPLEYLGLRSTLVKDLAPLKGMKLVSLDLVSGAVEDLTPLAGMPLTNLGCSNFVSDLTPLKGMKLKVFGCDARAVKDLTPLKGMPLETLGCAGAWIDLTPVKDAPLKEVFVHEPARVVEILRAIKTLEIINGQPAKQVLDSIKPDKN